MLFSNTSPNNIHSLHNSQLFLHKQFNSNVVENEIHINFTIFHILFSIQYNCATISLVQILYYSRLVMHIIRALRSIVSNKRHSKCKDCLLVLEHKNWFTLFPIFWDCIIAALAFSSQWWWWWFFYTLLAAGFIFVDSVLIKGIFDSFYIFWITDGCCTQCCL